MTHSIAKDQFEIDISQRLDFLGLDLADRKRLQKCAPHVMEEMGPALEAFYAKLRKTPEVRKFFKDEGAITSAQGRQNTHWQRIVDGNFGPEYVAAVRRIGEIHARIGLDPQWYIGGYGAVLDVLIQRMTRRKAPRRPFSWFSRSRRDDDLGKDISAVIRAALLDMDLSISVYLDNLNSARERVERAQAEAFEVLAKALIRVAEGDLSASVPLNSEKIPASIPLSPNCVMSLVSFDWLLRTFPTGFPTYHLLQMIWRAGQSNRQPASNKPRPLSSC